MLFISDLVFFHNYYFTVVLFDINWYSHPYLLHSYIYIIHIFIIMGLHHITVETYNYYIIVNSHHHFTYSDQNAYLIFVSILLSMFCIASFHIVLLWKLKHILTIILLPLHSPDITSHVWSHCNGHMSLHKRP